MANLVRGSTGDEVKKLQSSLINAGYDLGATGADGSYGAKTEAAVRKYQADNGLTVDGMAGQQTQGKLYGNNAAAPATQATRQGQNQPATASTPSWITNPTQGYDPATNEAYQNAINTLLNVQKQMPSYQDQYGGQLWATYQNIVNRKPFDYDLAADKLYEQYAKQYTDLGRMAMEDTIGQAAALTGGYGSTYAETAGQQQYNAYLDRLNDIVPQLEQRAYDRWLNEGDQMTNQFNMLGSMADRDYGMYQDLYNQWFNERSYAQNAADQEYDRGYNQWAAALNQYNNDREYQMAQDKFAYQKQQDALDRAMRSVGGSGSGYGGSSAGAYSNGNVPQNLIELMQRDGLGIQPTGNWDETSATLAAQRWGTPDADSAFAQFGGMKYSIDEIVELVQNESDVSKSDVEQILRRRGVDVTDPGVQDDIMWALTNARK